MCGYALRGSDNGWSDWPSVQESSTSRYRSLCSDTLDSWTSVYHQYACEGIHIARTYNGITVRWYQPYILPLCASLGRAQCYNAMTYSCISLYRRELTHIPAWNPLNILTHVFSRSKFGLPDESGAPSYGITYLSISICSGIHPANALDNQYEIAKYSWHAL